MTGKRHHAADEQEQNGGDRPAAIAGLDQATLLRVAEEVRAAFPHPPETAELVVIDVDPRHLHAFWEVPPGEAARLRQRLNGDGETAPLVLRLTAVDAADLPLGQAFDIEVIGLHGQFYVDIWDQPRRYQAVLGLRGGDGALVPLAPPVVADLPPLGPADDRTWREIALPPPPVPAAAPLVSPQRLPSSPAAAAAVASSLPPATAATVPAAKATGVPPPRTPPAVTIAPAAVAAADEATGRPPGRPTDGDASATAPAVSRSTPPPAAAVASETSAGAPPPAALALADAAGDDGHPDTLAAAPPWAEPAAIEHAAALATEDADATATVIFAGHASAAPPLPPPLPATDEPAATGGSPPPATWRPLLEPFPLPPSEPAEFLPDGLTSHWPFPTAESPAAAPATTSPDPGENRTAGDAPVADAAAADHSSSDGPPALPLDSVVTVSSFVHSESAVELEINAELHIFGRARPGSTVILHGRPVSVRPDGTFSISRPLPNGALVLSLLVTRDGGGPDES